MIDRMKRRLAILAGLLSGVEPEKECELSDDEYIARQKSYDHIFVEMFAPHVRPDDPRLVWDDARRAEALRMRDKIKALPVRDPASVVRCIFGSDDLDTGSPKDDGSG